MTIPAYEITKFESRQRRYEIGARRDSDSPWGRSRVYCHIEGETILENLAGRRTRPYTAWKPMVIDALREQGIEFTSIRWSQRCGCSCPCSPGFILEGAPVHGMNYYLSLEVLEEAVA